VKQHLTEDSRKLRCQRIREILQEIFVRGHVRMVRDVRETPDIPVKKIKNLGQ
jgi:hypothetical protein